METETNKMKNIFRNIGEKLLEVLLLKDENEALEDYFGENSFEEQKDNETLEETSSAKKQEKPLVETSLTEEQKRTAKIHSRMNTRLDQIENLTAANELFTDGAKVDVKDARRYEKAIQLQEKIKSYSWVTPKMEIKMLDKIEELRLKLQESSKSIAEIEKTINHNNLKIEELTEEVRKLHKSLNIKIDWEKANSLTTKERLEYFDNLAETIARVPVYEPVMVLCGSNDPFIVNRTDQEMFRTCYDEARKAKIKLDLARKNKEEGIKPNLSFDIKKYNALSCKERINYCMQIINQINLAPVEGTGVRRQIGKSILSIDSIYAQSFDCACNGYVLAKRDYACEIDWDKVAQFKTPQERLNYFDKIAENISKLPTKDGETEKATCGAHIYTIKKGYKNTFETCYDEVKKAEKEIKEEKALKLIEAERPIMVTEEKAAGINMETLKILQERIAKQLSNITYRGIEAIKFAELTMNSGKKLQKTL